MYRRMKWNEADRGHRFRQYVAMSKVSFSEPLNASDR